MQSYNQINFNEINPNELIDYIVSKHHGFTKNMLSLAINHCESVELQNEREITTLNQQLKELQKMTLEHFIAEEEILYPYVKKLLEWQKLGNKNLIPTVNLLENPINRFIEEHASILNLLNEIRKTTNNYTVSLNAKPALKLLHAELFELEQDLQKQIYIENNILFSKLLSLQNTLLNSKKAEVN